MKYNKYQIINILWIFYCYIYIYLYIYIHIFINLLINILLKAAETTQAINMNRHLYSTNGSILTKIAQECAWAKQKMSFSKKSAWGRKVLEPSAFLENVLGPSNLLALETAIFLKNCFCFIWMFINSKYYQNCNNLFVHYIELINRHRWFLAYINWLPNSRLNNYPNVQTII